MKKLYIFFICSATQLFAQWSPGGTQMTFTPLNHLEMKLAKTPAGKFFTSWVAIDTVGHIMLNAFDNNGNHLSAFPTDGIEISNAGGDYWRSYMATSEDGNAFVAWFGETTFNTGADRRHVFVQKYDISGNGLWNSGNPIKVSVNDTMHHMNPVIVSDGQKGCYIAWRQADLNLFPSSYDIFVQRYDSLGNIHSGWPGTPVPIATQTTVPEDFINLALAPDQSVLYMSYTTGSVNVTLQMQGINPADGTIKSGWTAGTGLTISPGTNIYCNAGRQPALYVNSSNEAIIIWVEFRSFGEIYMQRVSPSGVKQLAANGKKLYNITSSSGDDIAYFDSFRDVNDNTVFAFEIPKGWDTYIHVAKTDDDGNIQWGGSHFVTTSKLSAYPKINSDGNKGIFLFNKEYNSPDELYGMRIDSSGAAYSGWSLPGVSFGTVNNYDGFNPHRDFQFFSSGNIASVVWSVKGGDGLYDLFGCNLWDNKTSCTPTGIEDNISAPKNEISIYPNPMHDIGTLEIKNIQTGSEPFTLIIYNVVGQTVLNIEGRNNSNEIAIPAKQLQPGIYLYQLENNKTTLASGKFIVE